MKIKDYIKKHWRDIFWSILVIVLSCLLVVVSSKYFCNYFNLCDNNDIDTVSICSNEIGMDIGDSDYFNMPSLVYQYDEDSFYTSVGDIMVYFDKDSNNRDVFGIGCFFEDSINDITFNNYNSYYKYDSGTYFHYIIDSVTIPFYDTYIGSYRSFLNNKIFQVQIFYNYGKFNDNNKDIKTLIDNTYRCVRKSYAGGDSSSYRYNVLYQYFDDLDNLLCELYFLGQQEFSGFYPDELLLNYEPTYYIDGSNIYNLGYDNGYRAGNDYGYSIGYDVGYDVGYGDGYSYGYDKAYIDNPLKVVTDGANSLLNINLFGNFSIGDAFSLGITIVLFGVLMKCFRF